jgi:hypothetical protein
MLCAIKSACSEDGNFFVGEDVSHQGAFREYSCRDIVWRWRGSRGRTAHAGVRPASLGQLAGPSMCYGGWQAISMSGSCWIPGAYVTKTSSLPSSAQALHTSRRHRHRELPRSVHGAPSFARLSRRARGHPCCPHPSPHVLKLACRAGHPRGCVTLPRLCRWGRPLGLLAALPGQGDGPARADAC